MATKIEDRLREHLAMDAASRPHLWTVMALAEVSQEQVDDHLQGRDFAVDFTNADMKGPVCFVCEETAADALPFCPGEP